MAFKKKRLEDIKNPLYKEIYEKEITNPFDSNNIKEQIKRLVIESERINYWEKHHKIPSKTELDQELTENEWLLLHLGKEIAIN